MATGTVKTMAKLIQLLDYLSTNPEAVIRFYATSMQLAIKSDASYLSVFQAHSQAAGFFHLTSNQGLPHSGPYNGPIHIYCCIMKEVLSWAAEAELGALFHNSKKACLLQIALTEMGHPQNATSLSTDNSTAAGISNITVKHQRSKAINMRYYWIHNRVSQGQFTVVWKKGKGNSADYFTKHHPKSHHAAIGSTYLHDSANPLRNHFQLLAKEKEEAPTWTTSLCLPLFFSTMCFRWRCVDSPPIPDFYHLLILPEVLTFESVPMAQTVLNHLSSYNGKTHQNSPTTDTWL
jgi:hypothetical protein